MVFDSLAKRNEFIENNLGLVKSRLMKLNKNIFNEDLYQEGLLALILATDRFDKSQGFEFSTYAVKYIDGYILKYKKYNTAIRPLQKRGEWKFSYKDVISMNEKVGNSKMLIEDSIYSNDNVESSVINKIIINEFMCNMSKRDRLIIRLIMDGVKQSKISQIVGVSQQYVSRIVNREGVRYKKRYI